MPRYYIHNNKRGFCYVSRRRTLKSAIQEWIAKAVRKEFRKAVIYLKDVWENEIPRNSGGGVIAIDEASLAFYWEITEEPMELTIKQLTKPIEIYVVILDFYSDTDGRMLGSEPITVCFDEAAAMGMVGKGSSRERWRVKKVVTTGITGLQQTIDMLTSGE